MLQPPAPASVIPSAAEGPAFLFRGWGLHTPTRFHRASTCPDERRAPEESSRSRGCHSEPAVFWRCEESAFSAIIPTGAGRFFLRAFCARGVRSEGISAKAAPSRNSNEQVKLPEITGLQSIILVRITGIPFSHWPRHLSARYAPFQRSNAFKK